MTSKKTDELVEKDVARLMKKIRQEVQKNGNSLREIARAAGMTHPTLLNIYEGKTNPTAKTIFALARYLKVSATTFFEDD